MAAVQQLKFTANLSFMFKENDFLSRYKAASENGFAGVECGAEIYNFSKEDVLAALTTSSQQQIHLNAPTGSDGQFGLAAVPGAEDAFKGSLAQAMEYATVLRCNRIHVLSGVSKHQNKQEVWRQTYVSNLHFAAKECSKYGITLLIEPISTIQGYYLQHTKDAVDIVKEVGCPNLKVQLDLYHAQRTHGNITQTLQDYLQYIGHIQVSQVPNRNEPDTKGELDYNYIFATIQSLGYNEWIGCEYTPLRSTEEGLGWMKIYSK